MAFWWFCVATSVKCIRHWGSLQCTVVYGSLCSNLDKSVAVSGVVYNLASIRVAHHGIAIFLGAALWLPLWKEVAVVIAVAVAGGQQQQQQQPKTEAEEHEKLLQLQLLALQNANILHKENISTCLFSLQKKKKEVTKCGNINHSQQQSQWQLAMQHVAIAGCMSRHLLHEKGWKLSRRVYCELVNRKNMPHTPSLFLYTLLPLCSTSFFYLCNLPHDSPACCSFHFRLPPSHSHAVHTHLHSVLWQASIQFHWPHPLCVTHSSRVALLQVLWVVLNKFAFAFAFIVFIWHLLKKLLQICHKYFWWRSRPQEF